MLDVPDLVSLQQMAHLDLKTLKKWRIQVLSHSVDKKNCVLFQSYTAGFSSQASVLVVPFCA